jgi:hypothetical protein
MKGWNLLSWLTTENKSEVWFLTGVKNAFWPSRPEKSWRLHTAVLKLRNQGQIKHLSIARAEGNSACCCISKIHSMRRLPPHVAGNGSEISSTRWNMILRYVSGLCITFGTCLAPVIYRASRVHCQITCAVVSPQVRKEHARFLRQSCLTYCNGRNKQIRFISPDSPKLIVTVTFVCVCVINSFIFGLININYLADEEWRAKNSD